LVKYCIYCGQPSDDQALFCTSCGKGFPTQAAPPSSAPTIESIEQQPSGSYTAELEPGIHKHMRTDVYLKDSGAQVVLVAKLQSLLHKNYTVVDGEGVTKGQIVQKTHFTHVTYSFEDGSSNSLGAVSVSSVQHGKGTPRSCWIEDASGNRLANVVYSGTMSFSAFGTNESSIFDVYPSGDGGIRSAFSAVVPGPYAIRVNDATFPLPMVLTTIAALAVI